MISYKEWYYLTFNKIQLLNTTDHIKDSTILSAFVYFNRNKTIYLKTNFFNISGQNIPLLISFLYELNIPYSSQIVVEWSNFKGKFQPSHVDEVVDFRGQLDWFATVDRGSNSKGNFQL